MINTQFHLLYNVIVCFILFQSLIMNIGKYDNLLQLFVRQYYEALWTPYTTMNTLHLTQHHTQASGNVWHFYWVIYDLVSVFNCILWDICVTVNCSIPSKSSRLCFLWAVLFSKSLCLLTYTPAGWEWKDGDHTPATSNNNVQKSAPGSRRVSSQHSLTAGVRPHMPFKYEAAPMQTGWNKALSH